MYYCVNKIKWKDWIIQRFDNKLMTFYVKYLLLNNVK